ncbi:hypothetical protein [Paenibacillus sp. YYML68]|uniref:hypothetical protein n=1 Tax=Paenibacillus sp. YYML68 TaxID=2909250 RepID=UPI0024920ABF|nr:hypothetical protein [Paenibacillus sp. YYML68]
MSKKQVNFSSAAHRYLIHFEFGRKVLEARPLSISRSMTLRQPYRQPQLVPMLMKAGFASQSPEEVIEYGHI